MEDFDNLYFWNTWNKTNQGILVWNRIKRLHIIKKHVYKERKETTHVEVGEEDIHHYIYIYIYIKDKHKVHKHGHKTGIQEQGGKHSP